MPLAVGLLRGEGMKLTVKGVSLPFLSQLTRREFGATPESDLSPFKSTFDPVCRLHRGVTNHGSGGRVQNINPLWVLYERENRSVGNAC